MRFADPWYLTFAVIIPCLFYLHFRKKDGGGHIRFSSTARIKRLKTPKSVPLRSGLLFLRALTLLLLVLALMRPQSGSTTTEILSRGVDIVLAIDVSGSMRAMDFEVDGKRVTRLRVVKDVVKKFVKERRADRIGMVVFGSEAFTQSPLTLDHEMVLYFLDRLKIGMAGDATAIGSAVGISVKRLKEIESKSKIIILLTDGRNNAGGLSPQKAAEIARAYNIKIYTVGAGTLGQAPFMVDTMFGKRLVYQQVDLDEETLKDVASITGGQYFRATDSESLKEVYEKIDRMEKTDVKVKDYTEYTELFPWFLYPALVLFLFELLLANTRFRKIP